MLSWMRAVPLVLIVARSRRSEVGNARALVVKGFMSHTFHVRRSTRMRKDIIVHGHAPTTCNSIVATAARR